MFNLLCAPPMLHCERENVHAFVSKYQPGLANRISDVYIDVSARYDVPLWYLVRQGWVESRFDRLRVGDDGESYGIHQVKLRYFAHVIYYIKDDDVMRRLSNKICAGESVPYKQYFQFVGGGIESAAYILSNYYARYGAWEPAMMAYAFGPNRAETRAAVIDPDTAYRYQYMRTVLRGEYE